MVLYLQRLVFRYYHTNLFKLKLLLHEISLFLKSSYITIGPEFFTHIRLATLVEVYQKIHQSVYFLTLTMQLALNF